MTLRQKSDTRIGEMLNCQIELVEATRRWSKGADLGSDIETLRHRALRLNHLRYLDLIPTYRNLAENLGLCDDLELDEIVNNMMLSGEAFKSYDQAWLSSADFGAMTRWLESLFTGPILINVDGIQTIMDWRLNLRKNGVFLMFSSGTSGRLSFVPRDPMTWRSLCNNSSTYANDQFLPNKTVNPYDCLILGSEGEGLGIQGAANGLARLATRSHFLLNSSQDLDGSSPILNHAMLSECNDRAIAFIRSGFDAGRPLLIFGAPFQLAQFCRHVANRCGILQTIDGSIVATGGGWKSFKGEKISRQEIRNLAVSALSINPSSLIDAYGSTEINCTLLSCRELRYHIPPLLEPVILNDAYMGSINTQGFGTLGFLDPFALSYPGFVISGDQGVLRKAPCECGLKGWYIEGEIERPQNHEVKGCGGIMASMLA